jgi:NADP-dependent aldehyde dehydrogenase
MNFVAGTHRGGGGTFAAVSPIDGRELPGRFHAASTADVDDCMQAADTVAPAFAATSGAQRGAFLDAIAEEILAVGDELVERAGLETALPAARLTGERARTVGQLRLFADVAREAAWVDARIDRALPDRQPLPRPDLRRMKEPLGPVVVFGSSNFPLAFSVAGGDTASALCTGNPVVVKAHRAHPGTAEIVAAAIVRAAARCGLPAGVFSLLHGAGSVIGTALVVHPAARAVGFTGSRAAGRALCNAAASRPDPIPVFAEMSSLNPVFVLPGALAEQTPQIVAGFVASLTLGVGQFCTKPGLLFAVEGDDLVRFRGLLAEAVARVPAASMLHADIRAAFERGRERMLSLPGASVVGRAEAAADPARTQATALVLETAAATFLEREECFEEVFGPYALLVPARTAADLRSLAARLDGQLTATIHGTPADLAAAGDLLGILSRKAGRLIVNGFPTGVEVCHAMQHGGPPPATSDSRFTSVGSAALERFIRPVCYQDVPEPLLPAALQDGNPLGIERLVDGVRGRH